MTNRVVVTGMGEVSPLGSDWETVRSHLRDGSSGVEYREELEDYEGLDVHLGAPVDKEDFNPDYPRKATRSMGRVALLATKATETALEDAGLLDHESLTDGSTGVSYGSTMGNETSFHKLIHRVLDERTVEGIKSVDFLKLMSHTAPANLCQFFNINGRLIPTSSACTTGSQGVGYGYETIKFGQQTCMVTGGAEELVTTAAAYFGVIFAASTRNDDPAKASRPFDRDRDGLVVGEGAGTLLLESFEHAQNRDASIHGEILGFASNTNGQHLTIPNHESMETVMQWALEDASLTPDDIDYVNAHATATERGDIAESQAVANVLGNDVPVSSFKGQMGHTLGACGALETVFSIRMLDEKWLAPTLNLDEPDERCADLNYVRDKPRDTDGEVLMTNNFAFGGVNTSLIIRPGDPRDA